MSLKLSTIYDYFDIILKPTCEEYLGSPSSIKNAVHACMCIHHMKDWLYRHKGINGGKKSEYGEKLNSQCQHLKTAGDIITNAKHPSPEKRKHVLLASEIRWNIDHHNDTEYPTNYAVVLYMDDDSKRYDLALIVRECYEFWGRYIDEMKKKL